MAGPNLKDAVLAMPQLLLLEFDSPLAEIATPTASFTVNHGVVDVTALAYNSNTVIALTLEEAISVGDKLFVSYTPPLDISLCLRGVLPSNASDVDKKIYAVKQFSRITARNLLAPTQDFDTNLSPGPLGDGYPDENRPSNPRQATADDFILAYGEKETIQLTNLEDGSATSVNVAKLRMALDDANSLIDNYVIQAGRAGKFLISSSRRRTALMIARYYLDTVRRREDVYKDYQDCIKELEKATDPGRAGTPAIETLRGAIRTHRIPQVYNRRTGKGLSGWQTDSDMVQTDRREDLFDSQNLSFENGKYNPRNNRDRPNDSGGEG